MRLIAILSFLVALVVALPASANLRAPTVVEQAPSSALYKPKDADIVVLGEDLRFTCAPGKTCNVAAAYRVRAEAAVTVELAFITPGEVTIQAHVGDAQVGVKTVEARPIPEDTINGFNFGVQRDGLYEARFQAALAKGENTIRVEYTQQLGAVETGYGYFSDGEFVDVWSYESWPLKEWKLADDFAMNITVSTPREKPGWWTRNFGSYTEMSCSAWGVDFKPKRSDKAGRLWLRATLTEVPDRIYCRRGSDDYVQK